MTTQHKTARVERGPITEKARFKPLSDEEINDLWEGVYFTLGMAALLERQGFTVAAAELRRLHAENESLRAALAEQRLTDMEQKMERSIESLKTALAEPEGGGNLPPPLQKDFDHGIGADRFKVVRGAFWWHVLIGDSPTEHGKFRSRASAEKMAADLLREFRNGAFVQHEAALAEPTPFEDVVTHGSAWSKDGKRIDPMSVYAEPAQEPVAWRFEARHIDSAWCAAVSLKHPGPEGVYMRNVVPLYAAPPQRKPLTDEEIDSIWDSEKAFADIYAIARAVERAHGIV